MLYMLPTHSPRHTITQAHTHPGTHSPRHILTQAHTHSGTHSPMHTLTQAHTHPGIGTCHSPVHPTEWLSLRRCSGCSSSLSQSPSRPCTPLHHRAPGPGPAACTSPERPLGFCSRLSPSASPCMGSCQGTALVLASPHKHFDRVHRERLRTGEEKSLTDATSLLAPFTALIPFSTSHSHSLVCMHDCSIFRHFHLSLPRISDIINHPLPTPSSDAQPHQELRLERRRRTT